MKPSFCSLLHVVYAHIWYSGSNNISIRIVNRVFKRWSQSYSEVYCRSWQVNTPQDPPPPFFLHLRKYISLRKAHKSSFLSFTSNTRLQIVNNCVYAWDVDSREALKTKYSNANTLFTYLMHILNSARCTYSHGRIPEHFLSL